MDEQRRHELASFLHVLPPVEYCFVYGSTLHSNTNSMIDYIIAVSDPLLWHSENLNVNEGHYASLIARTGGAKLISAVAENIGVGVHFNPFVTWNNRKLKYGVVSARKLIDDLQNWKSFYLSGRLQKPVHLLIDNNGVKDANCTNLRGALAVALLLLPSKFSQDELYSRICGLSYMGDVRMLFAEDKQKVQKIVKGQFGLFQSLYKPYLEEFRCMELLKSSSCDGQMMSMTQDCSLPATKSLVDSLPPLMRRNISDKMVISCRDDVANCVKKMIRRSVMRSSARQAVAGVLAAGGLNAVRYLRDKMVKAFKSR